MAVAMSGFYAQIHDSGIEISPCLRLTLILETAL